MTAAFPPNGRGQINLPTVMCANKTTVAATMLRMNVNEKACQVHVSS